MPSLRMSAAAAVIAVAAIGTGTAAAEAAQSQVSQVRTVSADPVAPAWWKAMGPYGYDTCITTRSNFARHYRVSECYMYNGLWWFDYWVA
ncbi:hypothetical protein AB0C27_24790 [Nonomuraea sp. NPDC048882]|uniref:hypothetical protein n=1 Tax=unclassified Nonomuraea TaxID=2593643 RepID=UPI0033DFA34F